MKTSLYSLFLLIFSVLLISEGCSDKTETYLKLEQDQISKYLNTLGDTAYEVKPSGLVYIELIPGTGRMPVVNDTARIRFKGYFTNGEVFVTNLTGVAPVRYLVGPGVVLPGIEEGVRYMKMGGVSRFVTPSALAYGNYGVAGLIPAFTPLLWEVHLDSVKAGPGIR